MLQINTFKGGVVIQFYCAVSRYHNPCLCK